MFTEHSDHPLFRYLDDDQRLLIESIGRIVELDQGEHLIRAGEKDTRLFAVEQGVLEIVGPDGRVLASVGPGDVLGEVSFIDDSPRSASVRAEGPSIVRSWEKRALLDSIQPEPETLARFAMALNLLLVERLRDTAKAGVVSRR
ncbi:MAG: cyclic nucleotide-binding domain-containing protein [Thermoanaerobaculia bacterium]